MMIRSIKRLAGGRVGRLAASGSAGGSASALASGSAGGSASAPASGSRVQLGLAALTIAGLFAVVLVAPLPLWVGQPQGPPPPGAEPASAVGWPGLLVAAVFALGLALPFRPYRNALHAASAAGATVGTARAAGTAGAAGTVGTVAGAAGTIVGTAGAAAGAGEAPGTVGLASAAGTAGAAGTTGVAGAAAGTTGATGTSGTVGTVAGAAGTIVGTAGAARAAGQVGALPSARLLVALTALVALVALLIYPRFGSDIFDYLGFERAWVIYGDNPLTALPSTHPDDWATPLVWYPGQPPAYGPLWALLTWPIVRLAGDSTALVVLGYKLLSAAAYALCCTLVWAIVEPTRRPRALLLFAWSPLVLFEVLGKVHNDVIVAAGVLGAIWLVQRQHLGLGLVVAVGAALGKLTALAVAPPIALRVWHQGRWRALLPAMLGATLLVAALYAPFWAGLAVLQPLLFQTGRLVWSPGTLLLRLGQALTAGSSLDVPLRVLLAIVWLVSGVAILWRARRATTAAQLASSSGRLLLSSLLLLTTAVFAHYLVPAIALAAVSADAHLERWVFWLSIGALAAYAVELLSLVFGPDWIGSAAYQVTGSLVLLGPVLLASLAAGLRRSPR